MKKQLSFVILLFIINCHAAKSSDLADTIFMNVLQDSYIQFKFYRSQQGFLIEPSQEMLMPDFSKSFGTTVYQGSFDTEHFGRINYVVDKAVVFWDGEEKIGSGKIDMNKHVQSKSPYMSENKVACGGLCIGVVIIASSASCLIHEQMCTNRCNQTSCPPPSYKRCSSNCLQYSCDVSCISEAENNPFTGWNPPWSNGAWNVPAMSVFTFPYSLNHRPPSDGWPFIHPQ